MERISIQSNSRPEHSMVDAGRGAFSRHENASPRFITKVMYRLCYYYHLSRRWCPHATDVCSRRFSAVRRTESFRFA